MLAKSAIIAESCIGHAWLYDKYFLNFVCLCPKRRFNAQLIHGLYHHANIMAEDFTQQFIDNRHIGFATDMLVKLRFNHPHG